MHPEGIFLVYLLVKFVVCLDLEQFCLFWTGTDCDRHLIKRGRTT